MFLSRRAVFSAQISTCGKAHYLKPAWNFPTLDIVEKVPIPRGEYPRLGEREWIVTKIKQKIFNFPISATHTPPRPLSISESRYRPKPRTNSWVFPQFALKCARAFFATNPLAAEYWYCIQLRPYKERGSFYNAVNSYWVNTAFSRNEDRLFEAKQNFSGFSTILSTLGGNSTGPSKFEIRFEARWESPQGGTTLLDEELDVVADSISNNGNNLLEPLEVALLRVHDDLGGRMGFRPGKAVDMCHDVLEKYQNQQQQWRAHSVEHHVLDTQSRRYVVRTPAHHLGQRHVGSIGSHRAIIALGSNVGNRAANIEQSLQAMKHQGIKVRSTSFLYETEAMYYENQDLFLNGVCEVETTLEPLALLDVLQKIETELGRVKVVDKGPRSIDLDILLYDFDNVQHARLQIPHKLMLEREFVLRPLADIIPGERLPPPHNKQSILGYIEELETGMKGTAPTVVSNLGPSLPLSQPNDQSRRTRVMAVLNVTPDSFSDGGKHHTGQLDAIKADVRRFIADGATIIDVGGQSTRPGATRISWQEELGRVRPVIECIRSIPEAQNVAISVDTFYSDVARGAVMVGADIINDVSGGLLDPQMLPLIADLQVTIVLMHMRGTPDTMKDMTDYPEGVVNGVAKELLQRVKDAEKAGIPRWRIVLDPGIGFAKTQAQNLELLRNLDTLRKYPGLQNFPWLVGTSRKGFIGQITGVSVAAERGWGTAATVTTSIAGGADIVRVHDVSELTKVVKMADAMYRVKTKSQTARTAAKLSKAGGATTPTRDDTTPPPKRNAPEADSPGLKLSSEIYNALDEVRRRFKSTVLDPQELMESRPSDQNATPLYSPAFEEDSGHTGGMKQEYSRDHTESGHEEASLQPGKSQHGCAEQGNVKIIRQRSRLSSPIRRIPSSLRDETWPK